MQRQSINLQLNRIDEKKVKILSGTGLLITTIIWGSAFVVMKNSVAVIPPAYLLALRFTIAGIAMVIIFFKHTVAVNKSDVWCGSLLGALLFISYLFQTYGLKYTTASKNAFITTLYVILVPFLHWMVNKVRPAKKHVAAGAVAVFGLALLTLEGDLSINIGDGMTLICGFFFAAHMIFIDRYSARHDPIKLTVLQMVVAALLSWCAAPLLGESINFQEIQGSMVTGLFYLGIFSTMIGFLLQNIGQKYLTPNTSSILLSFESVFGLAFSVIFLGDALNGKMVAGCVLLLAAVVLSEYKKKN